MDNFAPFIGPRSRYSIIGVTPTTITHKMSAGQSLNGAMPRTALTAPMETDPEVSAGMAVWSELIEGGLYDLLGSRKEALIIENVINTAGAAFTLVDKTGTLLRSGPTTFPAVIAPGEILKFSGGTAGSLVSVIARVQGERIF